MANTSSFSAYTVQQGMSGCKGVSCESKFMSKYGKIFSGEKVQHRPLRVILPNEKLSNCKRVLNSKIRSLPLRSEGKIREAVGNKFQLDDVIEAQQFDRDTLNDIFDVAREMEKIEKKSMESQILKGYLMATLFYEPSTRTRLSFESAMKRLGGEVLTTENAREFSSAAKGETLEGIPVTLTYLKFCVFFLVSNSPQIINFTADSIRTVEGYSDIIVMRHFESGAAKRAAATACIPVINAGDGPGQHPTQVIA